MSAPAAKNLTWPVDRQFGRATPAKLAMWIFLLSDFLSFAGLLLAYGILRGGSVVWRHAGEPALNIRFTAMLTAVLIGSSVAMLRAQDAVRRQDRAGTSLWLGITALGGILFLIGQYAEWFGIAGPGLIKEGLVLGHSSYASTFYVVTGFHGLHVVAGVIYILVTLGRNLARPVSAESITLVALFWHFVDLVWNVVFALVYLLPMGSGS
jgi:cytochrome c oxidase subunit III